MKFGRSDFVLCKADKKPYPEFDGKKQRIGDYFLFTYYPHYFCQSGASSSLLIGHIFSGTQPDLEPQEILEYLNDSSHFEELLKRLSTCSGRFVLIYFDGNTRILHDPLGQFEVYYHESLEIIASSICFIENFTKVEEWEEPVSEFYNYIEANSTIQIGTSTKYKDVFHLMPNHCIDTMAQNQVRYFPSDENFLLTTTLTEGVARIGDLLKGIARAISRNHALALAVTGGHDSRILLGAFKDHELRTFLFKHPHRGGQDLDIKLASKLLSAVGRDYEIIRYERSISQENQRLLDSYAQPIRDENIKVVMNGFKEFTSSELNLFGLGGEVGRSFFKDLRPINSKKCAALMGFPGQAFVEAEMQKWIDSLPSTWVNHENIFDLFYWEQRMGNWGARINTEVAQVADVVSPMNSHAIFLEFFKIPKKHRQYHAGDLALSLIEYLDPRLSIIPINPKFKNRLIHSMIKLGVYNRYQKLRMFSILKITAFRKIFGIQDFLINGK